MSRKYTDHSCQVQTILFYSCYHVITRDMYMKGLVNSVRQLIVHNNSRGIDNVQFQLVVVMCLMLM